MSDKRKFGRGDKKTDDEVILNKHILKKGTGQDKPFKGCKVLYRYISRRDANDSSLGSSIPCAPEVLKLEGLSTYNALENCLTSMRKGEKSLFTLSTLDFKSGILERFLELELINWRLPDFDRIGGIELIRARKLKLTGDGFYQQEKYTGALLVYNNCISCVSSSGDSGESQQIKVTVYLNIAMCHQKLGDHSNAKIACNKALKIEPNNIKALYLHGSLYLKSGDTNTALVDFQKVEKLDPTDKVAIRQIEVCRKLMREKENEMDAANKSATVEIKSEKIVLKSGSKVSFAADKQNMDKKTRKGVK